MSGYETDLAVSARRFGDTLRAGDVTAALEHGQAVVETAATDGPQTLLNDLLTALQERDDETAAALFDSLSDTYSAVEPEEEIRVARANAGVRSVRPGTSSERVLSGYVRAQSEAELSRANVLTTVGLFLEDIDDAPDRNEAIAAIERAIGDERTVARRGERLEDADLAVSLDLPPTLAIVEATVDLIGEGTLSAGGTTTLTVGVRNVGNASASGVTVAPDAPDGVETDNERDLGDIAAGETVETTLELTGTTPGSYAVTVLATGVEAESASRSLTLTVSEQDDDGGLDRFDINGTPGIQAEEVLNAISAFNDNEEIGGRPVTAQDILRVIRAFNSGV